MVWFNNKLKEKRLICKVAGAREAWSCLHAELPKHLDDSSSFECTQHHTDGAVEWVVDLCYQAHTEVYNVYKIDIIRLSYNPPNFKSASQNFVKV